MVRSSVKGSRTIRFAGKTAEIRYGSLKPWLIRHMDKCLDVYPYHDCVTSPDAIIRFKHGPPLHSCEDPLSVNPSDHKEFSDGFSAYFPPWGDLVWHTGPTVNVDFHLTRFIASRNILFKLVDRECNFPYQYITAILHELVLIPTVLLFFDEVVPIHGSAIINKDKEVFAFSGTGGSGKTYLEMSLILKDNYGFFSDDMLLISNHCSAFANYQFPKIYQYNVKQFNLLNKFIVESYSTLNKLQWHLYPRIPYIGKLCRRLLDPRRISNIDLADTGTLKNFYFLFKTKNVNKIEKKVIDCTTASSLSYDIIKSEYHKIFHHIGYHKMNRSLLGMPELTNETELRKKYTRVFATLKDVTFFLVNIPLRQELDNLYEFIRESIAK